MFATEGNAIEEEIEAGYALRYVWDEFQWFICDRSFRAVVLLGVDHEFFEDRKAESHLFHSVVEEGDDPAALRHGDG